MIFVTVGTQLAFPRLLRMVEAAAPDGAGAFFAQTADPAYAGSLPHVADMRRDEFEACCARASLIVGHAGMGTILAARRYAKPLIVVPRRHAHGEHRNDHQMHTARQLARGGTAAVCETEAELAQALRNPPPPMTPGSSPSQQSFIAALGKLIDRELPVSVPSADGRIVYLGIAFDDLTLPGAADAVLAEAGRPGFRYVVTPNTDHVITLKEDAAADDELQQAYRGAWLCLNDSRVLEGLAMLAGTRLPVVTGSDLTGVVLARCNAAGLKVAVAGGDDRIVAALRRRYPGIEFATLFPPHGLRGDPLARRDVAEWIERTAAPITFLAVGAPQSELICREIGLRGRAQGVALCTGSGIAFASGVQARASTIAQRLRLEWLFRLLQEPRRLGPRYLVRGPRILRIWFKDRLSRT